MEFHRYDLYAFQLLHFLVSNYQYQIVTVRQQRKEMWLVNRDHEVYPIIRIGAFEDSQIIDQTDYMMQIKMIMLVKNNMPVLVLNTNPHSTLLNEKSFTQIPIAPHHCTHTRLMETFVGIENVVHEVDDQRKEYIRLTHLLETEQRKRMREQRKELGFLKHIPKLTATVILLCIVITLLATMTAIYLESDVISALLWGAYYKMNVVALHEYWRLLTAGFLHIDILHLLANMIALYTIGSACENNFTKTQYLIILICSIFVGNVFVFLTEGNVLGLGISGGIFGLLGAFITTLYANDTIRHPMVQSSVFRLLLMNAVISLFPGISLFAHLGGFVSGVFLGIIFSKCEKWAKLRVHVTICLAILTGFSCGTMKSYQNVEPLQGKVDQTLLKTVRNLGFDHYAKRMQDAYLHYYTKEELGL